MQSLNFLWCLVSRRLLWLDVSRSGLSFQRVCGVQREAHWPWLLPLTGYTVLTLGKDSPTTSPPFPPLLPTSDAPEGYFLMPIVTTREEEIIIPKASFDPLAQRMA